MPLHEHLIELGFIAFVQERGTGPLFYKPSAKQQPLDPLNPKRGPAVKTRERLGEWVRKLGVKDPELQPSHAWRHTFLKKARQAGIEPSLQVRYHGPRDQERTGETYAEPEPDELAEALKKFPRYDLCNAATQESWARQLKTDEGAARCRNRQRACRYQNDTGIVRRATLCASRQSERASDQRSSVRALCHIWQTRIHERRRTPRGPTGPESWNLKLHAAIGAFLADLLAGARQ